VEPEPLRIWVDADSCPRSVREVIQRASSRTGVEAVFVANRDVPGIDWPQTKFVKVDGSEGAADDHIFDHSTPHDLVVTRDIPLARRLVERGNTVLNDRGDVFTSENVRERLSLRNFMYHLRSSGLTSPGERSFGAKEVQSFANSFDRELTRLQRGSY